MKRQTFFMNCTKCIIMNTKTHIIDGLKTGDRVEIYRNLHKGCFSVRQKGRVVGYLYDDETMHLEDVTFAVQPAGRAKVLKEKRKNVHAFVRGTYRENRSPRSYYTLGGLYTQQVTYNPYKADSFVTQHHAKNPLPIYRASRVGFVGGRVYCRAN